MQSSDLILQKLIDYIAHQANDYKSKTDMGVKEFVFYQSQGYDMRSKRLKQEALYANLNRQRFKAYEDIIMKLNELVNKPD